MRKSKFTEEQVVALLREAEKAEKPIEGLCREKGISAQTFYRWRKKYGGVDTKDLKRMRELERENARLKRLVAVASPVRSSGVGDKTPHYLLRQKWASRPFSVVLSILFVPVVNPSFPHVQLKPIATRTTYTQPLIGTMRLDLALEMDHLRVKPAGVRPRGRLASGFEPLYCSDNRLLGRNFLNGVEGDSIKAIL